MRHAAILRAGPPSLDASSTGTVELHGVAVRCGIVEREPPAFDRAGAHASHVLVRVRGFSCNYRDQAFVLGYTTARPPIPFLAFGSDFAGEVVETGTLVDRVVTGDRVIANNAYGGPLGRPSRVPGGVVTNGASAQYHVLDARQVVRIPVTMPDATAAAFALNAQTAYSVVRKIDPAPGTRVLVTAARSNVAMCVIAALRARAAQVYAITSSPDGDRELRQLGATEVIHATATVNSRLDQHPRLRELTRWHGGFTHVFDPFCDLYLPKVVWLMAPEGIYVSCGVCRQHAQHRVAASSQLEVVLGAAIMNNLRLIFNCLGTEADLQQALDDYARGTFDVVVDSVFEGDDVGGFLSRTFGRDRCGKVVFRYA